MPKKITFKSLAASTAVATLVAGAALTLLPNRQAAAEEGLYINAVDLVIVPSEMSKFLEAVKENGANAVKEPGCRTFNISVQQSNPNHVFLYEVYDNAAALEAHRQTPHFKKFAETTKTMVADRVVHALSPVAMNSK